MPWTRPRVPLRLRGAGALLLVAAAMLAGCAADAPAADAPAQAIPASAASPDPRAAQPAAPPVAGEPRPAGSAPEAGGPTSAVLAPGTVLRWEGTCPCPAYGFELAGAFGDAAPGAGLDGLWLEVRVRWDGTRVAGLGLDVTGPSGPANVTRGFDDRLAYVWGLEPGTHLVHIEGTGAFAAEARLGSLDVPTSGDLLPNLVELAIVEPHLAGCGEVERIEQGAGTCLRFGNGVGNPGHGPLQVRLVPLEGALGLAGLGHFQQEVLQGDGSYRTQPVGPAAFHITHGHWHYAGLANFTVYTVDEASGLRGDEATRHGKSGFCFLDWGQMPENITEPGEQTRAETDCLFPTFQGWTNGVSRGWYDFYWAELDDQYVDIAGLPDGLYELVAEADPTHTLEELDETDNLSSYVLRLSGGAVELVEERAHFHVDPKDA